MNSLAMTRAQGFTLIELAIVIVIIGLLAGGVLVGRDMIRAAELRSITTEYEKYVAAVTVFQDKYMGLPGDLRNAESFWGTMSTGTCPAATGGTGTQTCNGDGDGRIEVGSAANQASEEFAFWKHLANAGLIEGDYTGMAGSGGNWDAVIDENVPTGRLSGSGWTIVYLGSFADGVTFNYDYGNALFFGADTIGSTTHNVILLPQELSQIDSKIDDGLPGRGRLIARSWGGCANGANNTDYDALYRLTSTQVACSIIFKEAF